jgi:Ca-activated chloride channel family protein
MANISFTCSLSSPVIPATSQTRLIYALIEVSGGSDANTLPLNVSLILDSSESMRIRLVTEQQFKQLAAQGYAVEVITDGIPAWQIANVPPQMVNQLPRRIDFLRDALSAVSQQIRPADHFSVVAFAGRAVAVVPHTSGAASHLLPNAITQIENINLGDETHLADGLALGFNEMLPNVSSRVASRMIVLTDGFTQNVAECYAWAQRARERGIVLSTLGIGSEFNEELLIPLADSTGGNAYYIETPEQIPEAFRRELGAALGVVCHNLEFKLQLSQGVELRRAHRVLPMIGPLDPGLNQNGSYSLPLGDYDPSHPPALLLELIVPPWRVGAYRAAQTLLAWDDPSGHTTRMKLRQDVVLQVGGESPPNGRVMNIVEKVGAFKLGTLALEDVARGDRGAATIKLRQAATRLLDMGEGALANEMNRQADALAGQGELNPNITKKLRYETRRITQNLE